MNPKISIIVPVYKVEQYLHKCIDSILAQTFTNFELILVDDGSPDQCGEICEEYARKDDRIVVIHKENGGLSSARNAGLDRAKGDYIGFVDSDDYIESDMYEILYNSCVKYQCEIANCSSIIYFPHKTVSNGEHQILIHTKEEAMKNMLLSKFYDEVVWVKLFKKDVIGDIRFPEGRIYEDTAFTYKVIDRCEKYCFVGEAKYHYIKREGSVMSSANKVVRLDALWAYEEMYDFLIEKYPKLQELLVLKLINTVMSLLNKICVQKDFEQYSEQYNELVRVLNRHFLTVIKLREYPKTVKILLIATKVNPQLYKVLINQIVRRK